MDLYDLQVAMSSEYYDQRTRVMRDRVSSQLRLSPWLHSSSSPSFSDDESRSTNSAFIKYVKDGQYYLHDAPESMQETLDVECLFDMDKENDDILRFEENDTQGHECGDEKILCENNPNILTLPGLRCERFFKVNNIAM